MSLSTVINKLDFVSKLDEQVKCLEAESAALGQTFERQKMQDFLIFKSLLTFEKNRYQPKPLQPMHLQQDELLFELGADSNSDDEDSSSFNNASFLREASSISSKKNSIFSLNMDSRKNSLLVPNIARHSVFSEFPKRRDSYFSKPLSNFQQKRGSGFVLPHLSQKSEDLKKRNSAILEDVSARLMNTTNLPQKSLFDRIKRASLKCNLSISSVRLSDYNHNYNDSLYQFQVGEEPVFSESGSDSQSDASEEERFEDFKEETYYKISFLKYEDKVFKESKPMNQESNSKLKNMNLIEDFFNDHPSGTSEEPKTGPRRAKKFNFMDPKLINYQPYYLVDQQGIVKHKQRSKGGDLYITRKANQVVNQEVELSSKQAQANSETIVEFGSAKTLRTQQNPQGDDYKFFVSTGVTDPKDADRTLPNNPEIYTMTFKNQALYSQSLNMHTLKDCLISSHFQMKFVPPKLENLQETLSPWTFTVDDFTPNALKILPAMADLQLQEGCYIKDNGSKRGTFVQTGLNNPIILQQGNLFLFNRKCGFYVKKIEANIKLEEETIAEVVKVNKKPTAQPNEVIPLLNNLAIDEEQPNVPADMKSHTITGSNHCSGIKLELVKWNDAFEYYEEHGTVVLLHENFTQELELSVSETLEKSPFDLSKNSKIFNQIMVKLGISNQLVLTYDVHLDTWILEQKLSSSEVNDNQADKTSLNASNLAEVGDSLRRQQPIQGFLMGKASQKPKITHSETLWMSVGDFDIMQDEFGDEWARVELPSIIMFGGIVFKIDQEKMLTSYE